MRVVGVLLFVASPLFISGCASSSSAGASGEKSWLSSMARKVAGEEESPHLRLAQEYHRRGRPQMAAQLYEASARYQPRDPHLRYLWAHALASSGNEEGAIEQARQSLATDPSQTETAALLGILLRRQGDNAEAIRLLEQAWNANPRSWDAGRELAEWYLARGESDRAASMLAVVREHSSEDRRADELFARAAEESGRLPEALAAWQKVHAVGQGAPREWDAVSHIARIRPLVQEELSPNDGAGRVGPFTYTSSREPAPFSGPPRSARWEYPPLPTVPPQ